ncbi:glutathione-disulfide reductase [Oceanospirillum sediminis]|uniref:Glutathione reductase n=1 Tax=Oceanospirillum sediminis TaxID=2760088 RepID=A0A839INI2_9GAMM|nr:glutathione-disulfide reductase [Oceanospirillum sediminis]MBB1486072.1 glutathione-disulfide reductase [Oceanospirillum sediminis]
MSNFDFDLFVIGAGSGGVRAARVAAGKGKKVAVAEGRFLGGTCVNIGCVPKKLFSYGSHFHEEFEQAAGFGWNVTASDFDWPTLRDNKTKEIERLNGIYHNLLMNSGVELIEGYATLQAEHEVVVNGEVYTAETILVATGAKPFMPEFPGNEHAVCSDEVFYLETFPKRTLVLGGGYIAVEFAGIFQGLGAESHLVYRGDLPLRGFDEEVRQFACDEIRKKGVQFHLGVNIKEITKQDSGLLVTLTDDSQLEVDLVLCATGRIPNTEGLGLETVGVKTAVGGSIMVDDGFQTNIPSIYALGDVINRMQLTPVALAEAMVLVHNLYEKDQPARKMDYTNIPTAVFCHPNIATVGLTEEQAREQVGEVAIYSASFRPLKHTLSGSEERHLMKLVVDAATDVVLGAHMVGQDAGEVMQGIGIAIKAGATKEIFDSTIGIHPTGAEEFVTMRTVTRN